MGKRSNVDISKLFNPPPNVSFLYSVHYAKRKRYDSNTLWLSFSWSEFCWDGSLASYGLVWMEMRS